MSFSLSNSAKGRDVPFASSQLSQLVIVLRLFSVSVARPKDYDQLRCVKGMFLEKDMRFALRPIYTSGVHEYVRDMVNVML
jgi:hypothetical protein